MRIKVFEFYWSTETVVVKKLTQAKKLKQVNQHVRLTVRQSRSPAFELDLVEAGEEDELFEYRERDDQGALKRGEREAEFWTCERLAAEVNAWLASHPGIRVIQIHQSVRDEWILISIFYEDSSSHEETR